MKIEKGKMRLRFRFGLVMLTVVEDWHPKMAYVEDRLQDCFLLHLENLFRLQRRTGFYADRLGVTMEN